MSSWRRTILAALLLGACANSGADPAPAPPGRTAATRPARDGGTVAPAGAGQDAGQDEGTERGDEAGVPLRPRQTRPTPRSVVGVAPASEAPPPPAPLSDEPPDFVFSFEQLRTGELGGRILHGTRPLFDFATHDRYLEAFPETRSYMVGTDINVNSIRFSPGEQVSSMAKAFARYPREIPFVSLFYTKALPSGAGEGLDAEVVAGRHDRTLTRLAEMLKGLDRPAFVRLGPEFNGTWNGYHKEFFAASFRHVVETFRKLGVTNAIYVWNYMPLSKPFPYLEWYPGDDVVDWWSIEVFDNHFRDPAANAEMRRFLADAEARGKPVIIAESGPATFDVDDPATWDLWFKPYFALINGNESIKAFCYSNVDFNKTTTGLEWRDIQLQDSAMAARYQQELRRPQYVHQR